MAIKNINIDESIKTKLIINTVTSESIRLGILLAIVGGFLDVYTFVCRGEVFANAQTGNLVLIGLQVYKGDFIKALLAAMPVFAFILGVLAVEKIKDSGSNKFVKESEKIILIIEIIVLAIIGFIPTTVPNAFVTIAISFVSSVQIASFKKLVDSPYSTTMCTGNLRSATEAAYIAFSQKNHKAAIKSMRYGIVIISFLLGSFLGAMLTLKVGVKSIWFAVIILVGAFLLFNIDKHMVKEEI